MSKLIEFDKFEVGEIVFDSKSFMSYGYGIVSQLVMKDRDISIQAKGLYGYLVSCAGNDKQTYPSQKKMCHDLNVKKVDTLVKYIKELQSKGYIKIYKTKKNNLHYRNVYCIATDTVTSSIWEKEYKEGKGVEEVEALDNISGENKKASPSGIEEADKKSNKNFNVDNSIPQNEEKYDNNFIENDLEEKNRMLMEQERVFVPNFKI